MDTSPVAAPLILFLPLLFLLVGIGCTIFWIWMIVDCATKENSDGNDKLIWILVIVLAGWIGALIYLLARRPKRIKQLDINTMPRRLIAAYIDISLAGIAQVILMLVFIISPLNTKTISPDEIMPRQFIINAFAMLIFIFKDIVRGRSIGKYLLSLQVIDARNPTAVISAARLIIRNIFCIILPIEALLIILSKLRLGDLATGTTVVSTKQRIEQSVPGYPPQGVGSAEP